MNGLWPIAEWEIPEGGPCCKHMLAKQNVKCTNDDGIRTREEYLLRYGIIHTNEKGVELVDYHRNCVPTKDKGNRCLVYKSKTEEGQFYQQIEEAMYQDRGTKMTLNYTTDKEARGRIGNSRIFASEFGEPCQDVEVLRYCPTGRIGEQKCSNIWIKQSEIHYEVRIIYPGFAMAIESKQEEQKELVYVLDGHCTIKNGRIQYVIWSDGKISQHDDKLFEYVKERYAISYGGRIFIMSEEDISSFSTSPRQRTYNWETVYLDLPYTQSNPDQFSSSS